MITQMIINTDINTQIIINTHTNTQIISIVNKK